MNPPESKKSKAHDFIDFLFKQFPINNALCARMRRADNPATEYQCWETLASFNINLESPYERLPYALISASIARSKQIENGSLQLGHAIADCYDNGCENDQAKLRLRRLLACDNTQELCNILRPLLSLIQSRINEPFDYIRLLNDLLWFNSNSHKIKARWAQQFYTYKKNEESNQ